MDRQAVIKLILKSSKNSRSRGRYRGRSRAGVARSSMASERWTNTFSLQNPHSYGQPPYYAQPPYWTASYPSHHWPPPAFYIHQNPVAAPPGEILIGMAPPATAPTIAVAPSIAVAQTSEIAPSIVEANAAPLSTAAAEPQN